MKSDILNNLDQLYPMPHVVLKAREILRDPYADFEALAKVIRTDQALAGPVVKMANSAFYRRRQEVTSIGQAVSTLGIQTVVQIMTIVTQSKMLGRSLPGYRMNSGDLWRHSLIVAAISEQIAETCKYTDPQEAFLAGLIHDAGKVILDPYLKQDPDTFQAHCQGPDQDTTQAERQILGFDHAEITARMCTKWRLSEALIQAIGQHHQPVSQTDGGLTRIVFLANHIAHHWDEYASDVASIDLAADLLASLSISVKDVKKIAGSVLDRVSALEEDTY